MIGLCKDCKWVSVDEGTGKCDGVPTFKYPYCRCHYEPQPIETEFENFCHNFEPEKQPDDYPM